MSKLTNNQTMKKSTLVITRANNTTINIVAELAVTPQEQERGFMERKKIPEGTGMLFVFERDHIASFWMKNTPTALSIAYIDSSGKIRDIFDMKPYSLEAIKSSVSIRYALEVPQGWFKKNNITIGDFLMVSEFKK